MASHEQLIRAVQLATRKLASSGNPDVLLKDVLLICVEAVGASGGTIYGHDLAGKRLTFQHVLPEEVADKLPVKDIPDDYGMAGEAFQTRKTQIREFAPKPEPSEFEKATGVIVRSMIAVPLNMEGEEPVGVVQLINKLNGSFDETDAAVLDTVAAVSTMAIINWKLTEEATRASTLLGMGKVSHDIGNLAASLYATMSYSDMALQGLKEYESGDDTETRRSYVEMLEGLSGDLKGSVDRIVGYSRLISDLSAGRALRPDKKLGSMAETIEHSASYLETEGRRNHVALKYDIASGAPDLVHDPLYVFRIVQNLVGNAIKAVRESISEKWLAENGENEEARFGEVTVRYFFRDARHVVEVVDSGPGMSEEVRKRILSGTARSQWDKGSGSGWGTKIVLELAATHDAEVSIDSEPGKGSCFRVSFPA